MWNADQYLAFHDLRLRPALDLLARIPRCSPATIVDLGCGPGNVAGLLMQRWPDAALTGVDSSPAMLARARARFPETCWVEADIAHWKAPAAVDLMFSNAALHWLDDHAALLPALAGMLSDRGVLAVQMPANFSAPSHRLVRDLAAQPEWAASLRSARMGAVLDLARYQHILSGVFDTVDLWETTYVQVLHGDDSVFGWLSGTTLLPYFSCLDGAGRESFSAALKDALAQAYPLQADGTVIFPFTRMFMVASNPKAHVSRETC